MCKPVNYEYMVSAIIKSGFYVPIAVIAIEEVLNSILFFRLFSQANRRNPLHKEWLMVILALLVSAGLFLPMLQTLCYTVFLPRESDNQPKSGKGNVEGRAQLLYMARYNSVNNAEPLRAYSILVDGTQYFCLGGDQLEYGSQISFLYYPKSRVIVSFQEEKREKKAEYSTSEYGYSKLGLKELLLFAAGILLSISSGFLASLVTAKKVLPRDVCWINGEFFYRNGIELILFMGILTVLAVLLIQELRRIPFIVLMIPIFLVMLIRDIPRSYALNKQTLSVYLFGVLQIRSVATASVQKIYLFHTEEGSLFVLDQTENELLSCKTMFDFIGYCQRNRKKMLFLPISEAHLKYAYCEFATCFGDPLRRNGLRATFPLWHE